MTHPQTFLNHRVTFDASTPLYRQIYTRIKNAISDGLLKANDRLPSARALAKEWGVARGTAEEAYRLLKDEGYMLAKGPLGCFIHPQVKPRSACTNKPCLCPVITKMRAGARLNYCHFKWGCLR